MIYVIENAEIKHLKIGYAIRPEARLAMLQTGNSCELRLLRKFPGSHALERKIHRDLLKHKVRSEWFYPDKEVWKYLDDLCTYEYEYWLGRPYLILWREFDSLECDSEICAFCGDRHNHTPGDGHRAPHCYSDRARSLTARDGTVLDCEYGYIVKSRKPAAAESGAAA